MKILLFSNNSGAKKRFEYKCVIMEVLPGFGERNDKSHAKSSLLVNRGYQSNNSGTKHTNVE